MEDKKEIYEKYQVKEYVIIESEEKYVLIYRLNENSQFADPLKITLPGKFDLKTLHDLEVELK